MKITGKIENISRYARPITVLDRPFPSSSSRGASIPRQPILRNTRTRKTFHLRIVINFRIRPFLYRKLVRKNGIFLTFDSLPREDSSPFGLHPKRRGIPSRAVLEYSVNYCRRDCSSDSFRIRFLAGYGETITKRGAAPRRAELAGCSIVIGRLIVSVTILFPREHRCRNGGRGNKVIPAVSRDHVERRSQIIELPLPPINTGPFGANRVVPEIPKRGNRWKTLVGDAPTNRPSSCSSVRHDSRRIFSRSVLLFKVQGIQGSVRSIRCLF